jgi:tetratricopeptide (TPR) repeat protein
MIDLAVKALKVRFDELDHRLDTPLGDADRAAAKADIIALFRIIEKQLTDLGALKEDVKTLVEKWKAQQAAAAPSLAPQFAAEPPVARADHLGASTFIEKGWSRISLGDYDGAEASLAKALELVPGDPQAQALLGWAEMLNEKYDEALMNFQKVLMREPQNALARINVGYICLKKKIFGEAIEHLSKAIRLGQDKRAVLYAHFYLGLVYFEREMYEDAENFFLKALALGPSLIEAYYELGRTYWFSGQRDEAKVTWHRGLAANKFSPWGKRCAAMLATVETGGAPTR